MHLSFYSAVFSFLNGPVYLILTAKVPKKGTILKFHTAPFIYIMISNVFSIINAAQLVVFPVVAEVIVNRNPQSSILWVIVEIVCTKTGSTPCPVICSI